MVRHRQGDRLSLTRATIELPGGRFALLRGGAGPLVIVLHGFPDHPPTFAPLIAAVAEAGFAVVAPWLRGYAPSTLAGPFDVERLAADVLELATALGHDRFALIGHDWGALITYATCALAPERVRAAVTLAVPHPVAFARSASLAQLRRSWYMLFFQLPGAVAATRARDLAFVDWLWRRWSPGFRLDDAARRELHACLAASLPAPIGYYRALLRPLRQAIARTRGPTSRRITTPLLSLHGADDGCVGAEVGRGQERHFRGPFEAAILPGLGHFLAVEAPEVIASRALAWLAAYP